MCACELLQKTLQQKLITSGRDKRLAIDHSITIRGCEWFGHAAEQGGSAISFVKRFYGPSYPIFHGKFLTFFAAGHASCRKYSAPAPHSGHL